MESGVSKLRKAAQGEPCQLRLPGICNGNNETTVLAHIRRGNVAGVGMKPPDLCAVHACSACHDAMDRRSSMGAITPSELDGYILEALCRQLSWWISKGYVAVRA